MSSSASRRSGSPRSDPALRTCPASSSTSLRPHADRPPRADPGPTARRLGGAARDGARPGRRGVGWPSSTCRPGCHGLPGRSGCPARLSRLPRGSPRYRRRRRHLRAGSSRPAGLVGGGMPAPGRRLGRRLVQAGTSSDGVRAARDCLQHGEWGYRPGQERRIVVAPTDRRSPRYRARMTSWVPGSRQGTAARLERREGAAAMGARRGTLPTASKAAARVDDRRRRGRAGQPPERDGRFHPPRRQHVAAVRRRGRHATDLRRQPCPTIDSRIACGNMKSPRGAASIARGPTPPPGPAGARAGRCIAAQSRARRRYAPARPPPGPAGRPHPAERPNQRRQASRRARRRHRRPALDHRAPPAHQNGIDGERAPSTPRSAAAPLLPAHRPGSACAGLRGRFQRRPGAATPTCPGAVTTADARADASGWCPPSPARRAARPSGAKIVLVSPAARVSRSLVAPVPPPAGPRGERGGTASAIPAPPARPADRTRRTCARSRSRPPRARDRRADGHRRARPTRSSRARPDPASAETTKPPRGCGRRRRHAPPQSAAIISAITGRASSAPPPAFGDSVTPAPRRPRRNASPTHP